MRRMWWVMILMVTSCDSIVAYPSGGHPVLARITSEPSGLHCLPGGKSVAMGLDENDNGVLDDEEVSSTQYTCVTAVARHRTEPPGIHCDFGGKTLQWGVDHDDNGALDDAEVWGTRYFCDFATPNVLLQVLPVAAGEHCAQGGQVSLAGRDTNGNGELESFEVEREVYTCA